MFIGVRSVWVCNLVEPGMLLLSELPPLVELLEFGELVTKFLRVGGKQLLNWCFVVVSVGFPEIA
jgi:hypothetical protein